MIVYALRCEQGHRFDGWFRSSDAFDRQKAEGEIACPDCGSTGVAKAPMAPNIARGRSAGRSDHASGPERDERPEADASGTAPAGGASQPSPGQARRMAVLSAMREKLEAVRRQVESQFDYVGEAFPEEARRIHYGETEHRDIYGEAAPDEVRELLDEGIGVLPLPTVRRTDS